MTSKHLLILKFFIYISLCRSQPDKKLLAIPQSLFDSDTCCWRQLAKKKQYNEASELIVSYLKYGNPRNRQSLNWHAGQMFALSGQNLLAKKYFRKTYTILNKWFGGDDGITWYYYAKGTIAFLNKDRSSLQKIISKWKSRYPVDVNYKLLLKLNDYWDNSYATIPGD